MRTLVILALLLGLATPAMAQPYTYTPPRANADGTYTAGEYNLSPRPWMTPPPTSVYQVQPQVQVYQPPPAPQQYPIYSPRGYEGTMQVRPNGSAYFYPSGVDGQ